MTHKPTDEIRAKVKEMSSYGIPQAAICSVIGVTEKTLDKYYRHELDTATAEANTLVANMLFRNCMEGKEASIFFWLKTRAGFKETIKQENRFVDKEGEDLHKTDKELLSKLGIDL